MKKDNPATIAPADDSTSVRAERPLVAGRDYYLENGWMVFTAEFLLRRGYCCGNGCRHCPYPEEEKKQCVA